MGKAPTDGRNGEGRGQEQVNAKRALDPSQQAATVHFPDSTKNIFYVSKKAEGSELFEKCVAYTGLNEKEYFALCFIDGDGNRHWIYDDKRISKQLRDHPWEFNFEVKFYPPEPASLNDDLTRHYLCLQVRQDIASGRLPATIATHALLGSYVAQSVCGDCVPSVQYIDFLKTCNLAPFPSDVLFEEVEELHKQHKGKTSGEAEANYLEEAKKLSMYGVHHFPAKDGKGVPPQIGVYAHGINIYRDQLLERRFLWQNIIKIAYRRNVFVIKVKPGELKKNETTTSYKMPDQDASKRVWKSAVEHHTFFRLIQPEEKPHKGLFRWGSAKFRYQGRTQFQSKIASQMHNNQPSLQRSESARLVRESDGVGVPAKKQAATLESPGSPQYKERAMEPISIENKQAGKLAVKENVEVGAKRSAHADGSARAMHEMGHSHVAEGNYYGGDALSQASPLYSSAPLSTFKASPETTAFSAKIITSPQSCSLRTEANGHHGIDEFSPTEHGRHSYTFQDQAVVYHPGHYEEEAAGGRKGEPREPPYEAGDDFVLIHRPKLAATGKIFHESGEETDLLIKEEEIDTYPIRYCANVYHSGSKGYNGGNRNIKSFEHVKWVGTEDIVSHKNVDSSKYPSGATVEPEMVVRMERVDELPPEPIQKYSALYNQGCYDSVVRRSNGKKQQPSGELGKESNKEWYNECDFKGPSNDVSFDAGKKKALAYVKESAKEAIPIVINRSEVIENSSDVIKEEKEGVDLSTRVHEQVLRSEAEGMKPKVYGQPSTSYNSPVHTIKPVKELPKAPVTASISETHSGPSVLKSSWRKNYAERREGQKRSLSFSDEERDQGEHKQVARISLLNSQKDAPVGGVSPPLIAYDLEAPVSVLQRESEMDKCKYTHPHGSAGTVKPQYKPGRPVEEVLVSQASRTLQRPTNDAHNETAPRVAGKSLITQEEPKIPEKSAWVPDTLYRMQGYLKGDKDALQDSKSSQKLISMGTFQRRAHENSPEYYTLSRTADIDFCPMDDSMIGELEKSSSEFRPKKIKYAMHKGEVEYVMKENVQPESYNLSCCVYRGPVESMGRTGELNFTPLKHCSAVYHPGYSYIKSKNSKKHKDVTASNEGSGDVGQKKTAILHMKGDSTEKASDGAEIYRETKYTWKWRSDDKNKSADSPQKKRMFSYKRHKGDVEVVDKSFVSPDTYKLNTEPCGESVNKLSSARDVPFAPLQEHVVKLPLRTCQKRMRTRDSSTESSTSTSSRSTTSSSTSSTVSEGTKFKVGFKIVDSGASKQPSSKTNSVFSFWKKSGDNHVPEKRKVPPKTPPKPNILAKVGSPKDSTDALLSSHEISRSFGPSTASLKGSEYEITEDRQNDASIHEAGNAVGSAKKQARLFISQNKPSTAEVTSSESKIRHGMGESSLSSDRLQRAVDDKTLNTKNAGDGLAQEVDINHQAPKKKPAVPSKSAAVFFHSNASSNDKKDSSDTDVHTSPVQEVPYQPLRAKISIQQGQPDAFSGVKKDEAKSNAAAEERPVERGVAYDVRVFVGRGTEKGAERKEIRTDGNKSPANFKLKGVHLRGPPSDVIQVTGSKTCPENAHNDDQNAVLLSRSHEIADFALSENTSATPLEIKDDNESLKKIDDDSSKKVAALHIREEQLVATHVKERHPDKKKEETKGGFFSFFRGHKSKDGGASRKGVSEKTAQDIAFLSSHIDVTSPESELQYKTLRAKIDVHDGSYDVSQSQKTETVTMEKTVESAYIPVYDFSYIPIFEKESSGTDETKKMKALIRVRSDTGDDERGERTARSIKGSVSGTFKRFFSHRISKDNEEYYDALDQEPARDAPKVTGVISTTLSSESTQKRSDSPGRDIANDKNGGAQRNEAELSSGVKNADRLRESSKDVSDNSPHQKTIGSWHETGDTPETITDVDQHGNVVRRTIKRQHVKQIVEKQVYQTNFEGQNGGRGLRTLETTQKSITPLGEHALIGSTTPVVETRSHTLAYESTRGAVAGNEGEYPDIPGELISSRTITQGNRTIETITYKTEKNGVIETHVEHRVTIHSGENIDHDAELNQAILEATNMNPDMTVEKIEVKQESQF